MPIDLGRHLLLATDVVGYGKGDDRRHRSTQRTLLALLDEAAEAAVLHRKRWTTQPSGDGELAILPATEPEQRLVDDFVRHLDHALAWHNANVVEAARLRVRVAVHVGLVASAANGFAGQAVVQVGRLLDCAPLRVAVEAAQGANLALIVSDEIHRGTISQGYTTYRTEDFACVEVQQKEYRAQAWIHLPLAPGDVPRLQEPLQEPRREPAPPPQVVVNEFRTPVTLRGGVIGIANGPVVTHNHEETR